MTGKTLWIMAFAAGTTVANLYYNQPLLDQIRVSFGVGFEQVGWVPTLTQIGYAFGMMFLVPLGDMFERKKLVLFFTLIAAFSLLLLSVASSFTLVLVGSLLLGLSTMAPQLLVPFATGLAAPEVRGKVVGTMMSGILLGILLARTVSGFVGASFGWRAMFALASGVLLLVAVVLAFVLPKSTPTYHGRYLGLLGSVVKIFKEQPVLREACLFGAVLFGSFSVFWGTLIHLMETPSFGLGARAVGVYGLLGAVAVGLSPRIGALADRYDARRTTGIMIAVTIASFLVFAVSGHSLVGIALGVLLMDIGVQSGHVSNQSRTFALVPEAQSRIQTAYMFCYFVGGALGSFLGSWSWAHFQWQGVCVAAIGMLLIALARYFGPVPSRV